MAVNKTKYIVLVGSIQDVSELIPAGQMYKPATKEHADELLEAGIIGHLPNAAPSAAEISAAEEKAKAEAAAEKEAKATAEQEAAEAVAKTAENNPPTGEGDQQALV